MGPLDYRGVWYCDTPEKVGCHLDTIEECARVRGAVALDVETTGLETRENKLVLLTLATPDLAVVIPAHLIEERVAKILTDGSVWKIIHNGPFDWSYLRHHVGIHTWPILDTKRAAQADNRFPGSQSSLAFLAKALLDVQLDKSLATSFRPFDVPSEDQLRYAANDALVLWPLYTKLCMLGATKAPLHKHDLTAMMWYLGGSGKWPDHHEAYATLTRDWGKESATGELVKTGLWGVLGRSDVYGALRGDYGPGTYDIVHALPDGHRFEIQRTSAEAVPPLKSSSELAMELAEGERKRLYDRLEQQRREGKAGDGEKA